MSGLWLIQNQALCLMRNKGYVEGVNMKYCRYCGTENRDEATFCINCGNSFDDSFDFSNEGKQRRHHFGLVVVIILLILAIVTVTLVLLSYFGIVPPIEELLSSVTTREASQEATAAVADTSTYPIPKKLVADMDDVYPEYLPSFTFNSNLTCDYSFNFYEGMSEGTGSYEVYVYSTGRRVIACDLGVLSGFDRASTVFYLFETSYGEWLFFGEGIGMTGEEYGGVFEIQDNETVDVECWNVDETILSSYIGDWENNPDFESSKAWLSIGQQDAGIFTYSVYGNDPFGYYDQTAILCPGGVAVSIVSDYDKSALLLFRFKDGAVLFDCVNSTGDDAPVLMVTFDKRS